MFQLGEPGLHAHSQSCKTHLTHWQESEEGVGHSRSATYEPSRCERSVMRACIWFQQGTRTYAINIRLMPDVKLQVALNLLLLRTLQLYHFPPPLLPVSNPS